MFAPVILPPALAVPPVAKLPPVIVAVALTSPPVNRLPPVIFPPALAVPPVAKLPPVTVPEALNTPVMYSPVDAHCITLPVPPMPTVILPLSTPALTLEVPFAILVMFKLPVLIPVK